MPEDQEQQSEKPDLSTVASARRAWVKALRSGEYTQGRRALKVVNEDGSVGYCCLGVAGDLCVKAGRAKWDGERLIDRRDGKSDRKILTPSLRDVFGLDGREWRQEQARLAEWNDRGAKTFADIAEVIEAAGAGSITAVLDAAGRAQ